MCDFPERKATVMSVSKFLRINLLGSTLTCQPVISLADYRIPFNIYVKLNI